MNTHFLTKQMVYFNALNSSYYPNYCMYHISALYVYPIKSLGGVSLSEASVTDRGFAYDRRWMLVDAEGKFLSQRQLPQMALLQTSIVEQGIVVFDKEKNTQILVPFESQSSSDIEVVVWDDACRANTYEKYIDEYFSDMLGLVARLVYMPQESSRYVEENYAKHKEITSFSDGYPFLLIGQGSLDELNSRLACPVPMNRFRPNMVFEGGASFVEDTWNDFVVADITFRCAKPCSRCVVTTIEQETALKGKEPLKTLATYRSKNNKILFGQNLLHKGSGVVRIGDKLHIQTFVS